MWIDTERVADAAGLNLSQAAEERRWYGASRCFRCCFRWVQGRYAVHVLKVMFAAVT